MCVVTGDKDSASNSESSQEASDGGIVIGGTQYPPGVVKVINANTLGLSQVTTADGTAVPAGALQTITMTNAGTAGGTIVQYAQSQDGQQFFVPGDETLPIAYNYSVIVAVILMYELETFQLVENFKHTLFVPSHPPQVPLQLS